jgi:hypothetical protein
LESKIAPQVDGGKVAEETFIRAGGNVNEKIAQGIKGYGLLINTDLIAFVVLVVGRYLERSGIFWHCKLLATIMKSIN